MKQITVSGKTISQMSLGTVQLGMNYGISNTVGKPDESESFAMLSAALENGITSIDTARAYGDSEDVLGRFFAQYTGRRPFINTKIARSSGENGLEKEAIESIETSLEKLRMKKVDSIMLHSDGTFDENCKELVPVMESLVKRGYTDMVGVSIYHAGEVGALLAHDVFNIIQIPMNIFDQRLILGGWVEKLAQKRIVTCVRSVFLQGLFFMDPDQFTDEGLIGYAAGPLRRLRELAEKENMTVPEFSIAYIRDLEGVTSLVLGADTPEQVRNNIRFFETKQISEETRAEIRRDFSDVNMAEIMKVLSRPKETA